MSRVQLALNVSNLDEAVAFYSKLFGAEVNKRKPGYANFAIAEPPLKLVLIEGEGGGTLNHLGVEVETADEVVAAEARLSGEGVETTGVDDTTCCYALKTETWVRDPDGAPWEWYVKTGDAEQMANSSRADDEAARCCAPAATSEPVSLGARPASARQGWEGAGPAPSTSKPTSSA
ncbi:MAG: VOC family protein [Actinobacteria bacterium]|nr:VOC family protein [Actinomycetota bacterium]